MRRLSASAAATAAASERGGNRPHGAEAAPWRHGQDPPRDHGANRDPSADPLPPIVAQLPPQPPRSQDLLQTFKQQSSIITKPEPTPTIRRRRRRGGNGDKQLTTASLADSYLRLCHDPCQDLSRWIAEDKSRGHVSGFIPPSENCHDENTTGAADFMEDARRLCGDTLHPVQGRMDADGKPRGSVDDLPARQGAGTVGHDQLRPLRAERGSDLGARSGESTGDLRTSFQQFSILATRWRPASLLRSFAGRTIAAFVDLARVMLSGQPPLAAAGWKLWSAPARPASGGGTGTGGVNLRDLLAFPRPFAASAVVVFCRAFRFVEIFCQAGMLIYPLWRPCALRSPYHVLIRPDSPLCMAVGNVRPRGILLRRFPLSDVTTKRP